MMTAPRSFPGGAANHQQATTISDRNVDGFKA
jgi:hypothetical protein